MKAVMVMYDSLDRNFLSPYGCGWTHTPNFERLSEKATRFDKFYVGSMPCIPARREQHTGRYNFLHRGWGPLESFDDSLPELLKKNGVYITFRNAITKPGLDMYTNLGFCEKDCFLLHELLCLNTSIFGSFVPL